MLHIIKYTLVAMVGAGVVSVVSLLWPRFTAKPQPQALEAVRNTVLGTEIGKSTAELLGVTDASVQPLNLSDTVSSVTGAVTSSVEQKVQQIVSDQVAAQVIKQYQQLPTTQQDRVIEMICQPKE